MNTTPPQYNAVIEREKGRFTILAGYDSATDAVAGALDYIQGGNIKGGIVTAELG